MKMLGLLLGATLGILLMAALYDELRDILEMGVGVKDTLLYFATRMPSYLSVVLPLSLLLSLLAVLSRLHRNNEITAIRAAGLNIFSTTRALWLAGIFFCGVSLLLNAKVIPWSVETSRNMFDGFKFRAEAAKQGGSTKELGLVFSVTFDNRRQNRMWFINRYSRYEQKAYGVSVSELDSRRRERTRILAREAEFDHVENAWRFVEGREVWFDPEVGEVMRTVAFDKKIMPHYNEDPSLMLLLRPKPQDLSFNELERITNYFAAENDPKVTRYEMRYFSVLFETMGPLIIIAIAIPFAISGVRVSPAVGVSKSIGLFILYYFLSVTAKLLNGLDYLEPMWAALMPNLSMIGLAAYFFGRMR